MRKFFEIGGVVAAAVLIAFGITALVMGINGQSTVTNSLKQEMITGTPDMTPQAIAPEVAQVKAAQAQLVAQFKKAGLPFTPTPVSAPSSSVANQVVNNGDRAHSFALYMRIHALLATNGLTYSQLGRWIAKPGTPFKFTDGIGGTSDPKYALLDPKTKQTVDNGRRTVWIDQVALATALNASYMAAKISLFGIVVGIALLLSGIGFGLLAIGGALRSETPALKFLTRYAHKPGAPAVPQT